MNIQKANIKDLDTILDIYAYAREQMKLNGNPNQWGDKYPLKEDIISFIEKEALYVALVNNEICGVFYFYIGEDETYKEIDGAWLNDKPYGAIHFVANSGNQKGLMTSILSFAENQIDNLKMDTHDDNKIMQHVLIKNGFKHCGRIKNSNKMELMAFQKEV